MTRELRLAVAQPRSMLGDVAFNVDQHAAAISAVEAQVVVFPELSLTGYGMDVPLVDPADPMLEPLVDACQATGSVALVGAPTAGRSGRRRLSMLRVDESGVAVAYDKINLGGEEPDHFEPGEGPAVLEIDGWRLGLAICKDTGVAEHAAQTAELGIDVYVAGVCETDDDATVQSSRAARIVEQHRVWVAYASFAGPTGGGFSRTAGWSAVYGPDGILRLQLGRQPGLSGVSVLA